MALFDSMFTTTYTIRTSELDSQGFISLDSIFRLLQESAALHSDVYELTIPHLLSRGLSWVVTKQRLEILRYPRWQESVTIHTWIEPPSAFVSTRCFRALDERGQELFRSVVCWALIDIKRRRPVPLKRLGELTGIGIDTAPFVSDIGKLDETLETRDRFSQPVPALYEDCDLNGHVTNSVYPVWCLRPLSKDFRDSHELTSFEIHYLAETFEGDQALVTIEEDSSHTMVHRIGVDRETEVKVVCKARSQWRRRETSS